ncbi:SOCS box domain-containing protein [Nephila pilipes]|uniref:SOCS box domain-containing protein n=1 Tax=Nephila pilipes TaxID=299642 RepID=A0A8X6T594_NEPPI|nr:SOCS box domain-containing protein [Nephila pilipes]
MFKRPCPVISNKLYKKIFSESNYVNNDLPFLYTIAKDIKFERVLLDSPSDVVKYSFIVHKSVTYLDLSVGEYGKREKLCFTMEAFKKEMLRRRYILYNYHLDVSKKLDNNFQLNFELCNVSSRSECFFLKDVYVLDTRVYNLRLNIPLATAFIRHAKRKIRSVMICMKLLNINEDDLRKAHFQDIFYAFVELVSKEREREDSELVYKFLHIHPHYLNHFFFFNYKPHLVEFALYHATHLKRKLFYNTEFNWAPPLFFGTPECFVQLIKYGYSFPFFPRDYIQIVTDIVKNFLIPVNLYDNKGNEVADGTYHFSFKVF